MKVLIWCRTVRVFKGGSDLPVLEGPFTTLRRAEDQANSARRQAYISHANVIIEPLEDAKQRWERCKSDHQHYDRSNTLKHFPLTFETMAVELEDVQAEVQRRHAKVRKAKLQS